MCINIIYFNVVIDVLHASYKCVVTVHYKKKKSQKHAVTVLRTLDVLKLKYSMPESNWLT